MPCPPVVYKGKALRAQLELVVATGRQNSEYAPEKGFVEAEINVFADGVGAIRYNVPRVEGAEPEVASHPTSVVYLAYVRSDFSLSLRYVFRFNGNIELGSVVEACFDDHPTDPRKVGIDLRTKPDGTLDTFPNGRLGSVVESETTPEERMAIEEALRALNACAAECVRWGKLRPT